MRAFVMQGIDRVAMSEKPVPDPGPDDAIVKATTALVCTSDTHTVHGAIGDRHDLTLGHEAVGIVARLGSNVTGFREGDRVAVNAITPCYRCHNCQRGFTSQCQEMLGGWKFANQKDGIFADYFHVNAAEANLAPIPEGISDEQACYCCDMLSTGFAGAENAANPIGGTVAVFAQGPVGLMATVGARLLGAGRVIAVESMPARQELARHYGADDTVDFSAVDAVEAILELTGGYHGDGEFVPLPRAEWGVGMGDKTIRTALCPGGAERMGRLMRLIANGRVDPRPMTTHRFPFAEVEKAFRMMAEKADGIIKPLIDFG